MKRERRRPGLWSLVAVVATLIMAMLFAGLLIAFRFLLNSEYIDSLQDRLTDGLSALRSAGYSHDAAAELNASGVELILFEESTERIIYRSAGKGHVFNRSEFDDRIQEINGFPPPSGFDSLSALVSKRLADQDGSFFLTELHGSVAETTDEMLQSRELYLVGRSEGHLFGLYLPVERMNDAINLSIRYASITMLIGLAVALLLIFLASRWAHKSSRGMARIAGQISELDFSERCIRGKTRETDTLAVSINRMSDRLQEKIGELETANERLQDELTERTEQQRLITDLFANLSHDLKTPIAIISGYAEGLQEGLARTPEQQQTYYQTILTESEHMQTIVGRMMTVSSLELETEAPVLEDFDLAALLDACIAPFQLEIKRQGLDLKTDYPAPISVRSDYEGVRQSVLNYVQNAIYHVNDGNQIRISVSEEGESVRLSVRNSARPIPEQEIPKLWEKLYRGDRSRTRSHGEAGLGLAIVRDNMERLGLEYGFRNLDGMVEFYLCLPRSPAGNGAAE